MHPTSLHKQQERIKERINTAINKEDNAIRSTANHVVLSEARNPFDDRFDNTEKVPSQSTQPIVSGCTKLATEVTSLIIVSVKVTHQSSSTEVFTHALLDNGSQGTFIHKDLLDQLKVPSIPASITVKTMTGETTERCLAVDNLQVCSVTYPPVEIKLSRCYSRRSISVEEEEEVPTLSRIKRWKYLSDIHKFLPKDTDLINIGIIIGGNCPKALEPIEIIPSVGNDPYAYRSVLGWCITEPITKGICQIIRINSNVTRFIPKRKHCSI